MTVKIGEYEFDQATYDAQGDVLYLRVGESRPAANTYGTPEGHAVRFDEDGTVIGITIVNAKWLSERDGKITITVPNLIETRAEDLALALAAAPAARRPGTARGAVWMSPDFDESWS